MASESDRPDMQAVSDFDRSSLKRTQTCEKTGAIEGYAQEKALQEVSAFAKDKLHHVDTKEKNKLPTQDEIDQEKKSGF